jgi:integrase
LRSHLTFLGIIECFDLRGEFPDGRTRQMVKVRGKYQFLSLEFKSVIYTYCETEIRRGIKKASTIYGEMSNAASFLFELQCGGIDSLEAITQKSVIDVFLNEDGTLRRSCSYKKILAAVFKANTSENPALFTRLIAYLPVLRDKRKNIQYLTDEEVAEVKGALAEPNSALSFRDKAIGQLALSYGLRCCDIAALKLSEIDLDSDVISICQQKTAEPLKLPLTTSVGNAIYDYVTLERMEYAKLAKSDCECIFLAEHTLHGLLRH